MDPDNVNYTIYNVFTAAELEETESHNIKKRPQPSEKFKLFLNRFNKSNTEDTPFDAENDWVVYAIYSLLREYKNGNLERKHNEAWYQSHIWNMIEICFDRIENLEAVIGKPSSFASKREKNKGRAISSLEAMLRMSYGHRCDLVFRIFDVGHSTPCEFGACEAGAKNDGITGTKFMNKSFYKLTRILKDMLDYLLTQVNHDKRSTSLRTVGFLHSGLACTLIELDRPTAYISRVKRHRTIEISDNVSQFGATVLPSLMATWTCCAITKEILDIVSISNQNIDTDDNSWLDNCLGKPDTPFTPTTSSSTESARKRQKYK
ncbi:MAG: hypothetical protein EXX96DRAFT_603610 [Benjaminiella poitrasii]|nr:MAG: hypothetical protein EXX96DRAFT_603610 [Benjaminiella poitrasii]